MNNFKYCLKPDKPDARDRVFFKLPKIGKLPKITDLSQGFPTIYNQENLGSCTANAIGAALDFIHRKNNPSFFNPSRLFIYYNEREMEGTTGEDRGASIRDGIKSVNKQGACSETLWPYDVDKFDIKPHEEAYLEALNYQSILYSRVPVANIFFRSTVAFGYPIVFGMDVYESFESEEVAKTGIVPLPDTNKEQLLGGHAVVAVGYDDNKQRFKIRNSWGEDWGDKGYFYLPYEFAANSKLVRDAWQITRAE